MNEGTGEIRKSRMSRKIKIGVFLLLIIAGISSLLWLVIGAKEPSYQDKPLSDWLARAAEGGYVYEDRANAETSKCREAIRAIGTNAIPHLLRILKAKDSPLRKATMNLMERGGYYIRLHIRSVEEDKRMAWVGFYFLAELASNAVPDLVAIYQNPPSDSSKRLAEMTLMRLYPAKSVAVPYWLPAEERAEWFMSTGYQIQSESSSNAVLAFSQAIQLQPTNVIAYCSRGDARLQLREFSEALLDFEKALELERTNGNAIFGRGCSKFGLKDFRGAEADFTTAINLATNDSKVVNARGLARANLRDLPGALADFNKAIELTDYGAAYYRNRAMVERMQKEYELALEDASKSLELYSKEPGTWVLRGGIHTALKEYSEALADLNKAIQLDARDSDAYATRAVVRVCKSEFDKAGADLERAFELKPANANAFLVRGLLRMKRGGEDDLTLSDLERAVELAPQAPETHGVLGLFQYRILRWEPALANCRKALELGRQSSDYYGHIWIIRAQSGEEKAANQELQNYLKSLENDKANEWSAHICRFLTGNLPETNLMALATSSAKRPSAITNQICQAFFYAAMKRKLGGDKQGALELLQKCVDTKIDNDFCYMDAVVEIQTLKGN